MLITLIERENLMNGKRFSRVNKIRIRPPLLDHYDDFESKISDKIYGAII